LVFFNLFVEDNHGYCLPCRLATKRSEHEPTKLLLGYFTVWNTAKRVEISIIIIIHDLLFLPISTVESGVIVS